MEYYDVSTSPGPADWAEEEREINGYVDGEGGEEEDGENDEQVHVEEKVKHERADPVLSSEVIAILNELGHYNRLTNTYQLDQKNCQPCLRDLIRYLRNDGNSFFVRRQMGLSNIVNNDLLPIIEQHTVDIENGSISQDGKLIMDRVIRLLVDLTNPTMLHYRDSHVPKNDKDEIPIYLQLQQILFKYKISFALKKRFWVVLAKHLTRILSLEEVERELEDTQMFERIIILIRNVLHIPIMENQSKKNNDYDDFNVQDRIVEYLHEYNILDILQYMISSNDFQEYCFHVIEIIFLIYREQSAEFIAKSITDDPLASENLLPEDRASLLASAGRSEYEIDVDTKEIEEARLRDRHSMEGLRKQMPVYGSGKYSRPTFIVQGMKSISDRDMICHQIYLNPEVEIDLNKDKKSKTRARNRRLMEENIDNSDAMGVQRFRKSSRKIRLILGEFANKFLNDCYNSFMKTIRHNLSRASTQDHDETYYLWAAQFFMEFNRFRPKVSDEQRYECILETVSATVFHYIQTHVDNYLEHLGQKQFKLELGDWAKRLHCALRTYRELLFTLQAMDNFPMVDAKKLSNKIKTDLFTEQEYRELLFRLLKEYDEMKMSKAYLRDLIETNHLFLKMLEYHVKISFNFKVNVNKKVIKRSNKKKKKDENEDGVSQELEVAKDPEEIWNDIHEKLLELLNSDSIGESNIIESTEEYFDPLSEKSVDEQKLYLMRKVNYLLLEKDSEKAIKLFRGARMSLLGLDEDNAFGDLDMGVEDELIAMKEILMTEFPKELSNGDDEADDYEDEDAENNNENDEDEDEGKSARKEIYFNMDDTVRNYAKPQILRAYRLMLKNYRHNKPETNHAIVKMLHRIGVDIKMSAMFYNLGYLSCFEKILSDPALKYKDSNDSVKNYIKAIKDLAQFAHFITRNFFKLLQKYPKIAAEICFTANARDCYSMEFGYDDSRVGTELKALKGKGGKKRKASSIEDSQPSRPILEEADIEELQSSMLNFEESDIEDSQQSKVNLANSDIGNSQPSKPNLEDSDIEDSQPSKPKRMRTIIDDDDLQSSMPSIEDSDIGDSQLSKPNLEESDIEDSPPSKPNLEDSDIEDSPPSKPNLDDSDIEDSQPSKPKRMRAIIDDDDDD